MDNPPDAFLEGPLAEIQEETDLQAAEAKLGIELGEMGISQVLYRFGLHDHLVVDNQIHPVGALDQEPLPIDIQVDLSQYLMPILS